MNECMNTVIATEMVSHFLYVAVLLVVVDDFP